MTSNKNDKFDAGVFNQEFEETKKKLKTKLSIKDDEILNKLNNTKYEKSILQNNMNDMLIGIKDSWINLLDDFISLRFSISMFTKENRLFYIGLTVFIFTLILYIVEYFFEDDNDNNKQITNKIIETRYIYNKEPYNMEPYNLKPYNMEPYNMEPFNKDSYNMEPYNKDSYNMEPYNKDQYNMEPFKKDSYNIKR